MKRDELIQLLQTLPENAEITSVRGDDMLADYYFETELSLEQQVGHQDDRGTIWTSYSNYVQVTDRPVRVFVLT